MTGLEKINFEDRKKVANNLDEKRENLLGSINKVRTLIENVVTYEQLNTKTTANDITSTGVKLEERFKSFSEQLSKFSEFLKIQELEDVESDSVQALVWEETTNG